MADVLSFPRRHPAPRPEGGAAPARGGGQVVFLAGAASPPPAQRHAARAEPADAEFVTYRLEEAGATLLALPHTGPSTRLRQTRLDIVRCAIEAYGWDAARARPPVPSAERIDRMDEALGWIALIPRERHVLRRIVGARCLVSPLTERHLYSWRRLGGLLGADHRAVQRWHAEGIGLIVAALNGGAGRPG